MVYYNLPAYKWCILRGFFITTTDPSLPLIQSHFHPTTGTSYRIPTETDVEFLSPWNRPLMFSIQKISPSWKPLIPSLMRRNEIVGFLRVPGVFHQGKGSVPGEPFSDSLWEDWGTLGKRGITTRDPFTESYPSQLMWNRCWFWLVNKSPPKKVA